MGLEFSPVVLHTIYNLLTVQETNSPMCTALLCALQSSVFCLASDNKKINFLSGCCTLGPSSMIKTMPKLFPCLISFFATAREYIWFVWNPVSSALQRGCQSYNLNMLSVFRGLSISQSNTCVGGQFESRGFGKDKVKVQGGETCLLNFRHCAMEGEQFLWLHVLCAKHKVQENERGWCVFLLLFCIFSIFNLLKTVA